MNIEVKNICPKQEEFYNPNQRRFFKDVKLFEFDLPVDKTIDMLDKICQSNKKQFDYIMNIGNKISEYAKNEQLEELEQLVNQNSDVIPLLRGHVQEAFESVLHLRFDDIIEYFLENGYQINQEENNYLIDLCKTSRFFACDPPVETFNLLIKYGVDVNQMEEKKYRTALHYACKYGILEFVQILIENGAEIDPVDFKKRTPFNYAQKKIDFPDSSFKTICNILKKQGGDNKWNNYMQENNVY